MVAISTGKVRLVVKHGNGKSERVVDEADIRSFTDALTYNSETVMRLKKTFALIGARGDYLEVQYYSTTQSFDVSGGGDGVLICDDISNLSEAAQLGYYAAKYSPFGGVPGYDGRTIATALAARQVEKTQFDIMGDPDSRQTDATVDTTISAWSTISTIKPNSDNVLLFRAGTWWEVDKSSCTAV